MPHALRLQALGVRTGLARLDRGHVDDQAAAGQAVAGAVRAQAKQHLFDHIAVFQQAERDVGPGASLARGGANDGSICGQDFGLGLGAVPDAHRVADDQAAQAMASPCFRSPPTWIRGEAGRRTLV